MKFEMKIMFRELLTESSAIRLLAISGRQFTYFSEFATLTAGSGTVGALAKHYIDSKLNSPSGEMPKQINQRS